ncbi:hypothetical protein [Inhella gelatinilytica]|uniref:Uncharacterized protein n=1 Tax=Inhella gelatinilytica TaxID=2795030 RepID=A0A931IU56_9BURK|nr:hypothetical protein [Inhella gelatinilytica]MBH9552012.1 hypothetical protein [Inhella gelatinilytica]
MRSSRVLAVLWLGLPTAALAHGGSDWMLAVTASYSSVLLGGAAGVLAAWKPALTLPRWVLVYGLLLGALTWAWQVTDTGLALTVLALACVLTAGAFGVLRWVARRVRSSRAPTPPES